MNGSLVISKPGSLYMASTGRALNLPGVGRDMAITTGSAASGVSVTFIVEIDAAALA